MRVSDFMRISLGPGCRTNLYRTFSRYPSCPSVKYRRPGNPRCFVVGQLVVEISQRKGPRFVVRAASGFLRSTGRIIENHDEPTEKFYGFSVVSISIISGENLR